MIRLEYDAIKGTAFKDGEMLYKVMQWVDLHNQGHIVTVVTATENALTMLRVAVKRHHIAAEDVEIWYRDQKLRLYPDGGIDPWPKGFADFTENMLMELF